eukprot:1931904-Rhodomonas_salina.1
MESALGICRRPLKSFQQPKQSDKGPRWVKDKAVFWCKNCNTDFSVVVRKVCCLTPEADFCRCEVKGMLMRDWVPTAPLQALRAHFLQPLLQQQADADQVRVSQACASVQQVQRFMLQGRPPSQRGR